MVLLFFNVYVCFFSGVFVFTFLALWLHVMSNYMFGGLAQPMDLFDAPRTEWSCVD